MTLKKANKILKRPLRHYLRNNHLQQPQLSTALHTLLVFIKRNLIQRWLLSRPVDHRFYVNYGPSLL